MEITIDTILIIKDTAKIYFSTGDILPPGTECKISEVCSDFIKVAITPDRSLFFNKKRKSEMDFFESCFDIKKEVPKTKYNGNNESEIKQNVTLQSKYSGIDERVIKCVSPNPNSIEAGISFDENEGFKVLRFHFLESMPMGGFNQLTKSMYLNKHNIIKLIKGLTDLL